MDVASRRRNPVDKGLMPGGRIGMCFNLVIQPLPATLGAVELDYLKPVRPSLNQWLPSLSIKCDAFEVAAAPFVDDRDSIASALMRIEQGLPMLRTMSQRESQHVGVADQQAKYAICLLFTGKVRRLGAMFLVPNPSQSFRRWDGVWG